MLYLCMRPGPRIVGYVIINMSAVKICEATIMENIYAYMKDKGYTTFKWREPREILCKMLKVKEW